MISIGVTSSGTLMRKSLEEAYDLLEEMTDSNYQWPTNRALMGRGIAGIHLVDIVTALLAKMDALLREMASLKT